MCVNDCSCHVSLPRLETLEVANEKLSSLNSLSEKSFALHAADFRSHTRTIANMKKELDSVFRRIRYFPTPHLPHSLPPPLTFPNLMDLHHRFLKARLAMLYPEAYSQAEAAHRAELEETT